MFEHCEDETCVSCNYQRDHPEDPYQRITLIYASVLRKTFLAMSEASEAISRCEPAAKKLGMSVGTLYHQLVINRFVEHLPSVAEDINALVAILSNLLPDGVLAHSREVYETHMRTQGKEQVASGAMTQEDIEQAIVDTRKYFDDLIQVGAQYLTDGVIPTHNASRGLQ